MTSFELLHGTRYPFTALKLKQTSRERSRLSRESIVLSGVYNSIPR